MEKEFQFGNILKYDDLGETPDKIIAELGEKLEKETNGYVRGEVNLYDGPIESYSISTNFSKIVAALGTSAINKNIQDDLGEQGYDESRYEFSLVSPYLDMYKYRLLFFEFGIGLYPVKVVLEQGIADEIFQQENAVYTIELNNKDELENMVFNILNTKKVVHVMQNLIYAAMRKKS